MEVQSLLITGWNGFDLKYDAKITEVRKTVFIYDTLQSPHDSFYSLN